VAMKRTVEWRQADAMQLPFRDETFDAVVYQFGVMFFPEKSKAFSEARRVLRPGGVFIFKRVESDHGKRIRGNCSDHAGVPLSHRSAALPGPHAPRLSRPSYH